MASPGSSSAPATAAADADDLSFTELVSLAQPSDLALDAFSTRGLLNARPRSAALLSSLKLAPGRFLQRYEVVAESGALTNRCCSCVPSVLVHRAARGARRRLQLPSQRSFVRSFVLLAPLQARRWC